MPITQLPDPSGAAWMNEVDRRLRELETAPSLTQSSVKNGSITFYDTATPPKVTARIGLQPDNTVGLWFYNTTTGNPVIKLGAQSDGTWSMWSLDAALNVLVKLGMVSTTPEYGIDLRSPGGRDALKFTAAGQVIPKLYAVASGSNFFISSTVSAAFVEMFRNDIWTVGNKLDLDFTVVPNGSTISWQVTLRELAADGLSGGTETSILTNTGVTVTTQVWWGGTAPNKALIDLPSTPNACWISGTAPTAAECVGRRIVVRYQMLRSAGATTVSMNFNSPMNSYVA